MMGNSASLFFSSNDPQSCLDWRIRPSDDQYDLQKVRWNNLAEYLLNELPEKSGYPMSSWLQGSYKFGTQIRPVDADHEFDIDLGMYFKWAGRSEDGNWDPSDLKNMVQRSLSSYIDSDDNDALAVSEPKHRCNRIHYAQNFHIDIPSYHLNEERDARALATEDDEWENSDPKAIYKWWTDTIDDESRPRARRLVRYLKMWAVLGFEQEDRPSSILLTVLAADALLTLDSDNLNGDDEYFSAIVEVIFTRLLGSTMVPNPVNQEENLNRLSQKQSGELIVRLQGLASIAQRALAMPSKAQAAETWSEAFKHFFPIPDEDDLLTEGSRALAVQQFEPIIEITATTRDGTQRHITGRNGINQVPKDCDIEFRLANAHQLPPGAVVSWTVRNEGKEAEDRNDLGHVSEDGLVAHESSAYQGRHYMDVSVKMGNLLIARRRVPVTVSAGNFPPRNPTRRPGYVKFRSKRR